MPLPSVSVVVPTRNEVANVARLHEELAAALAGRTWELCFVDDSDDETVVALHALGAGDPRVMVVHRPSGTREGGLGGAVVEGFRRVSGEVVVVMDADLQHPPTVVGRLCDALEGAGAGGGAATGFTADIAVASRYTDGGSAPGLDGAWRRFVSRACRALVHLALPRTRCTTDPLGGFFAVRRSVVAGAALAPDGYKILLEVLVRCRWSNSVDVPYTFAERHAGSSKSGLAEGRRFLRHVRALRRVRVLSTPAEAATAGGHAAVDVPAQRTAEAPLRTMIFTSEAPPVVSGISNTVAALQDGLSKMGHEVDVVTRADFPRFMRREIRLSAFALFWPRFRSRLRHYDVINVHGPVPTMSEVFLTMSRRLDVHRPAIVYTHHSDLAIPGLERWCDIYNRISGRLAHTADAVVVSSDDYGAKMARGQGAPVTVIPWGVRSLESVVPRTSYDGDDLRVLFVGQLRPYKGLHVLFDALSGLHRVRLTVVGDGPMRAELQARAKADIGLRVDFRGRVADEELWRAYSEHDVIVLPSTTTAEAFGLVLAEGMASGCVPVASDLPGVREVAAPTGFVAPPGDVAALRTVLATLAGDRRLLEERRAASVARAFGELSMDRTAARYDEVFRSSMLRTAGRDDGLAVPPSWSGPRDMLDVLTSELGVQRASLALLHVERGRFEGARVWQHGGLARKVATAPVAAYAASRNAPLLIAPHTALDDGLRALLTRPHLTSAIVVPVHRTRRTVSVAALSTSHDDDVRLDRDHLDLAMDLVRS